MAKVSPTYHIVVKAATSYTSGSFDLTPGDEEFVFRKATNIGYSEIVGNIPTLFFTLSQDDPQARAFGAKASDYIFGYGANHAVPYHFLVYRNGELVWGGLGPMEIDETSRDMIVYAYGYASALYWTLTGWKDEFKTKTIKQIVDTVFAAGQAKTNSMMAWLTSGTTQAPATTSDGATDITLPYYQANYKRILFLMREMAAYASSDTTNRVWFEVDPSGTFNFWKDRGTTDYTPRFFYPGGIVLDFARYRMPVDTRTKLYGVGTSPTDVALQTSQEATAQSNTRGLKEDSIYMQWVRDSDELDRVTRSRLRIAKKVDKQIALTLAPNSVAPIRATGGLRLMYDYVININKGSVIMNENKLLVGNQVLFTGGREYVRPIFQDVPA